MKLFSFSIFFFKGPNTKQKSYAKACVTFYWWDSISFRFDELNFFLDFKRFYSVIKHFVFNRSIFDSIKSEEFNVVEPLVIDELHKSSRVIWEDSENLQQILNSVVEIREARAQVHFINCNPHPSQTKIFFRPFTLSLMHTSNFRFEHSTWTVSNDLFRRLNFNGTEFRFAVNLYGIKDWRKNLTFIQV